MPPFATIKPSAAAEGGDTCYVVVHVGAGYHSRQKAGVYKAAIKDACVAAMEVLEDNGNASDAVEAAICVLEDNPATNAGIGSNLNRAGQVECDAAIMSSRPDAFGAVGAVSTICNPIQAANAIRRASAEGPDAKVGLVPPMFLAGDGADSWAEEHGVATHHNRRHKITDSALAKYAEYMERTYGERNQAPECPADESVMMDTVGAVCIDRTGEIAAGVSSGGIALKYPGRVGEAAMFGCGCWAESRAATSPTQKHAVGCSVSGTGEQIMRTMLARTCAQRKDDIFTLLDECFDMFATTPSLAMYTQRNAGLVILRRDPDNKQAELGVAHTTQTMGYGYMASGMSKPRAAISRKSESEQAAITAIRL